MLAGLVFGILLLVLGGYAYMQSPPFGARSQGERLERMQRSPQYRDGVFHNLEPVPRDGAQGGMALALIKYALRRKVNPAPPAPLPTCKTDLRALDRNTDVVVWLGHSSYFVQLGGHRLLIDPVFSENAAPLPRGNPAFAGSNIYSAADMPNIDALLISHDHWDHLDYPTATALRGKVRRVVCGLGVGASFVRWGYAEAAVTELDWNESVALGGGLNVHAQTARHYSSRGFARDSTLWLGFAQTTPQRRLFFSGDSGYGRHFEAIGKAFGGFDLVMLDSGQYDADWPYIHMTPEEAARAARDLQAETLLPAHVGKFSIAFHSWDDPFRRSVAAAEGQPYSLLTPKVGEVVTLPAPGTPWPVFPRWWEELPR